MAKKNRKSSASSPQKARPKLARKDLVGKFPHIEHQPAPEASHYRLTEELRSEMVSRMKLL